MTAPPRRATDVDPLYDPTWAIFIYAGWASLSWLADDTVGLLGLVVATVCLALWALRSNAHRAKSRPEGAHTQRSFAADFSTVLLFCAAAIGAGVLFLRALETAPELVLSSLLFGAAGAIAVDLGRQDSQEAAAEPVV